MSQPSIFISYSQKDEAEKDKLLSHLGVLQRAGLIDLWSVDQISAGAETAQVIDQAIARAKVAILLISANFLTSDFILNQEVPKLLKRRQNEGLVV
ncbi:MAG: toll/interleukin-1 receptor domain-containing protein, partial [Anaerolineae bacterium]|nr:toll/interleukin-1 receptor domain-containing protein [Anaerolineae bacterium]